MQKCINVNFLYSGKSDKFYKIVHFYFTGFFEFSLLT